MPRHLRVVDGRVSDYVRVPRTALVEPSMEAQAVAGDLAKELATVYALVWSGKRTRALNLLAGVQLSVANVLRTFHAFTGYVEELPSDVPGSTSSMPIKRSA